MAVGDEGFSYSVRIGGGIDRPARRIRLDDTGSHSAVLCFPHHPEGRYDRPRLPAVCGEILPDRPTVLRMEGLNFSVNA